MKILKSTLVVSSLVLAFSAFAEDVNVKGLDLTRGSGTAELNIKLSANLNDNPELKVVGKTIELRIPNAHVTGKMLKKAGDITLVAAQADRSTVKVSAILPESLKGSEGLVSIVLKDNAIGLTFPSTNTTKTSSNVSRSPSVVASAEKAEPTKTVETVSKEAEKLDENYLQNLEKEHEKLVDANHKSEDKVVKNENADRVKLSQSGVEKGQANTASTTGEGAKSSFSVAGYIGKFVAFLGIMLLGFYGVLTLFKKGVIKKGKLGFLHSTKLVEVLSTTHIAPKRSLMMVKAHKQVFLISSSETGISLISEIGDVTGLIKTGEEELTGSNFDTNLKTANSEEKEFRLKNDDYVDYGSLDEMLNEPDLDSGVTSAAKAIEKKPVKDTVKFSDQIKTRVKNLKQI